MTDRGETLQDDLGRHAWRVLRLLVKGSAVVTAREGRDVLIEIADVATIGVAADVLPELATRRLVAMSGQTVSLTSQGLALARRAAAPADGFGAQHRDLARQVIGEGSERQEVEINLSESPLGGLARRKDRNGRPFLDQSELRAGERLRADFERAQLRPRLGANWQAAVASGRRDGGRGGIADLTDAAIAARQRIDNAMADVGPELSGVLIDVCCFLKGLETVEAERRWPVRSAKLMLKCALAALARHYEPAPRSGRRPSILHWGAEGYRPRMARS